MTDKVVATDLIYLTARASVKPEHDGSPGGDAFRNTIEQLRSRSSCSGVVWGRSIEEPSLLAVVVRWTSTDEVLPEDFLEHFSRDTVTSAILTFRFLFDAGDLLVYPTVEIALPCFSDDTPVEEVEAVVEPFTIALRRIPEQLHALGLAAGWLAHPSTIPHNESPTGKGRIYAMFIGWQSIETHLAATETQAFKIPAGPMRMRMLPFNERLGLMHFVFRH